MSAISLCMPYDSFPDGVQSQEPRQAYVDTSAHTGAIMGAVLGRMQYDMFQVVIFGKV